MAFQGFAVILALVAEQGPKRFYAAGSQHQSIPVIVPRFVAKMAQQCAVGLVQVHAVAQALRVVGFRHVDGDGPAGMAGEYGLAPRPVGQKRIAWPGVGRVAIVHTLQPQPGERIEELAFGRFQARPARDVARQGQIRQGHGLAAGHAKQAAAVLRHRKVAGLPLRLVVTLPVEDGGISLWQQGPQARRGTLGRRHRMHCHAIGHESEGAPAMHAMHAVEKHQLAAMAAIEDLHGGSLAKK